MVSQHSTSQSYWQAKIWGLLHDSPLKPIQRSKSGEGPWNALKVMEGWQSPGNKGWIKQADYIASASDRAVIGALRGEWSWVNYDNGLELRHLLSGQPLPFHLRTESCLHEWRSLTEQEEKERINQFVRDSIPIQIRESKDAQEVFWWLWRCLPEALSQCPELDDPKLLLIPAETRIPDCSIWSHNSMTAALAGSLTGYDGSGSSRPYIVSFTFVPIQEVVKASRKMQDFWAGSWILHYLSASICWAWAEKYGPDTVVYPSLYAQPLIDHWLLKKYSQDHWHQGGLIEQPSTRRFLTAGFPNVLVAVLPEGKVKAAVDLARRMLTGEDSQTESPWMTLAEEVKQAVFPNTSLAPSAWREWLASQWQIYWTALPLGDRSDVLARPEHFDEWQEKQNQLAGLYQNDWLFTDAEKHFFEAHPHQVNIGSWWAPLFDQVRNSLNAVKNPRVWSLPTAFCSRSSVSGLGAAVHEEAANDWCSYDDLKKFWVRQRGLFDGREQLNATEVVKRGIKRTFEERSSGKRFFDLPSDRPPAYPDLTVGTAGWLKCYPDERTKYQEACEEILSQFSSWAKESAQQRWGIPWVDENETYQSWTHPRLLNSGWLIEDFEPSQALPEEEQQKQIQAERSKLSLAIGKYFPNRNPTDWYVLASGDGDSMSEWLKGTKMENYRQYVPSSFLSKEPPNHDRQALDVFLEQPKRMGPATHAAFSRSLLDFSNHLVPYLTEQRYAGRLIYAGGDDVLAYTNLWEWDNWLWDIRQCFKGTQDPQDEFDHVGDYWRWKNSDLPANIPARPLFTLGSKATISFGVVIAHQSVPLAIALENLWEAEAEAKEHFCFTKDNQLSKKDAVQVRVLYGNGNILKATSKFNVFNQWQLLLDFQAKHANINLDPALFEQAAQIWNQHPAPVPEAIELWAKAFCERRDAFAGEDKTKAKEDFQQDLSNYLSSLCLTTPETPNNSTWQSTQAYEIQNWLKLAAFVLRNRDIKLGGEQ